MGISGYICDMKRMIFVFILFVMGLTAYAAELINVTSDNANAIGINQYGIEVSSVHDSNHSISCDNTFDNPVSSIIFAHCSNIHSGYVRTLNRGMRLMYRYNSIAFLKTRKIPDIAYCLYLRSDSNVFCSVKQSGYLGFFIRFRKLLI